MTKVRGARGAARNVLFGGLSGWTRDPGRGVVLPETRATQASPLRTWLAQASGQNPLTTYLDGRRQRIVNDVNVPHRLPLLAVDVRGDSPHTGREIHLDQIE